MSTGRCKNCTYKPIKKSKAISTTSKKKKARVPAKFDAKTRELIMKRDKFCICGEQGTDCHHIFFGQEAENGLDRNNIDKGILLCRTCHARCHACKMGESIRQECIDKIKLGDKM